MNANFPLFSARKKKRNMIVLKENSHIIPTLGTIRQMTSAASASGDRRWPCHDQPHRHLIRQPHAQHRTGKSSMYVNQFDQSL
jgi:hypothetical protein